MKREERAANVEAFSFSASSLVIRLRVTRSASPSTIRPSSFLAMARAISGGAIVCCDQLRVCRAAVRLYDLEFIGCAAVRSDG